MARKTSELIRIAAAGGGFSLDAKLRTTSELTQIASAAARGGGTIHLNGMEIRKTSELEQIASAGKGRVVFDI